MNADEIADLEHKVEHARAVAAISIGQPDRAQNVAYREQCEAELREARAKMGEDQ